MQRSWPQKYQLWCLQSTKVFFTGCCTQRLLCNSHLQSLEAKHIVQLLLFSSVTLWLSPTQRSVGSLIGNAENIFLLYISLCNYILLVFAHTQLPMSPRSNANCSKFLNASNATGLCQLHWCQQGEGGWEMAGWVEQSHRILTALLLRCQNKQTKKYSCLIPGLLLLHIEAPVRLIGSRITLTWLLNRLLKISCCNQWRQ